MTDYEATLYNAEVKERFIRTFSTFDSLIMISVSTVLN